MKTFNILAQCNAGQHYMVNISGKLRQIRAMVDSGYYFVINRARQYGKTTTLQALGNYLKEDYAVISLDFQMMSSADFADEKSFANSFAELLAEAVRENPSAMSAFSQELLTDLERNSKEEAFGGLRKLFLFLSSLCASAAKPVVLIIDEVDSASNNQVFLDFLAILRGYYLARASRPGFHSVILAGVYDIKNLKLKLRPEEEHKYNSPWNIAARFDVDMSFSPEEISGMLKEYEQEKHTGMDIMRISRCIYDYTSGYPYLVSYICKLMDETLPEQEFFRTHPVWTEHGIAEAVKLIVSENSNPLFESMTKQLSLYPELRLMLEELLYQGKSVPYSPANETTALGVMFGFLKAERGLVTVSNRIFEMALLNLFTSEEYSRSGSYHAGLRDRNQFLKNGMLDMDLVIQKFVEYYTDVFDGAESRFLEDNGRRIFLMYLKPIINGTGNYYLEAATRDLTRTDVIVDYLGKQFIIEMKIWHGNEYNERGEQQLCGYLDFYRQKKGWLLSFNFNKHKMPGVRTLQIEDKTIVEAVV